jgi:N-acylneuraminate cytidylyltransferase
LGAEVPYLRSKELSNDFAITVDVIADSIIQLKEQGNIYDFVCCIYPVTPLLRIERLKEASEIIRLGDWNYVFPAIEFSSPIERGFTKGVSGVVNFKFPEFVNTRTQDIDKAFHDAGQFYLGTLETWQSKVPLLSDSSFGILLSKYEVVDIDDEEDWKFSEEIFKIRETKKCD